jgi:catechol O-methyltransferase
MADIRASLTGRDCLVWQTRGQHRRADHAGAPIRVAAMSLRQRMPFLRWSVWRLALGMPSFIKSGQIGDGREQACAAYVEANARRGDVDDVLATVDRFATEKSMLVNVGTEKGELLDAAVRRASPGTVLELGTYCGYSALRIARAAPSAHVYSVEFSAANAEVAQRIWSHASVDDRITCVVGTIGDGGKTLDKLAADHGFATGNLDLMFIDHDKRVYLPDLQSVLDRGWLHTGSIVVADNVGFPGAPQYRAYMKEQQGKLFDTVEHKTHVEYQSMLRDLVLESEYLGG